MPDPITPDALRSAGFTLRFNSRWESPQNAQGQRVMHSPAWTWGPWCYGNDYECNDIPPPADMAGVRKVCEALGIKLTESSQDV